MLIWKNDTDVVLDYDAPTRVLNAVSSDGNRFTITSKVFVDDWNDLSYVSIRLLVTDTVEAEKKLIVHWLAGMRLWPDTLHTIEAIAVAKQAAEDYLLYLESRKDDHENTGMAQGSA